MRRGASRRRAAAASRLPPARSLRAPADLRQGAAYSLPLLQLLPAARGPRRELRPDDRLLLGRGSVELERLRVGLDRRSLRAGSRVLRGELQLLSSARSRLTERNERPE